MADDTGRNHVPARWQGHDAEVERAKGHEIMWHGENPYHVWKEDGWTKKQIVNYYSTNIAWAFTLLEGVKGWTLSSNAFITHYKCCILDRAKSHIGEADTAPLAIVRAWLAWKGD